jgi:hypothetical protein
MRRRSFSGVPAKARGGGLLDDRQAANSIVMCSANTDHMTKAPRPFVLLR